MARIGLLGILVGVLTFGAVTPAAAASITFDTTGASGTTSSWTEAGFFVSGIDGKPLYHADTASCTPTCADNGTRWMMTLNSFFGSGWSPTIRITASDSSGFTFGGFDGAENPFAGNAGGVWAQGITVTGTRANLTTLTQTFTLDQANDGAGGSPDFQTFLSTSFFDVFVQLDFTGIPAGNGGHDFSIDNVLLNEAAAAPEVPEPASLLLFGTGLAALARRRLKARSRV